MAVGTGEGQGGNHFPRPQILAEIDGKPCRNVSTTPITAMECLQCLPFSVVQLKGKHCGKPHGRNGVVDMFGPCHFGITTVIKLP